MAKSDTAVTRPDDLPNDAAATLPIPTDPDSFFYWLSGFLSCAKTLSAVEVTMIKDRLTLAAPCDLDPR